MFGRPSFRIVNNDPPRFSRLLSFCCSVSDPPTASQRSLIPAGYPCSQIITGLGDDGRFLHNR
jgi:hypothetical protein